MKLLLPKKAKQSGQVVLITLLILAVVLSIGMSIISRSVTDVRTSQQSQESARAFWVAQGELEKAIRANLGSTSLPGSEISYSVSKSEMGGSYEFVYPELLGADYPATIWLVNHVNGSIGGTFVHPNLFKVYWGNNANNKTAIEVTFVYFDTTFKVAKYAFDVDKVATGSNFSDPTATTRTKIGDSTFNFNADIDLSASGLNTKNIYFARINFLGNSDADALAVRIDTNKILPSQGSCFESTSVVLVSGISRKLTSCQLWEIYPSIFDNTLFSGNSI